MHSLENETQLDFFLPVGTGFALVVAGLAPTVLEKVASRMGRNTRLADHAGEEETA